jgi:hypothetical protein
LENRSFRESFAGVGEYLQLTYQSLRRWLWHGYVCSVRNSGHPNWVIAQAIALIYSRSASLPQRRDSDSAATTAADCHGQTVTPGPKAESDERARVVDRDAKRAAASCRIAKRPSAVLSAPVTAPPAKVTRKHISGALTVPNLCERTFVKLNRPTVGQLALFSSHARQTVGSGAEERACTRLFLSKT